MTSGDPALTPFRPAWWLPGPHLPTIWGKKVRRQAPVHDRVERVATADGDYVSLARVGVVRPGVPHLLVLHGLEATVRSNYAQALLAQARVRGWSADLLLFRSCDGVMNSAPRLYHSGETGDVDWIVRRLGRASPSSPLLVCGVSLGGNVLLKWMGERRDEARLLIRRAAAVSVPFDLAASARRLEQGIGPLYARHFLRSLRAKALLKARQFPGLLDERRVISCRSFREFDDAVTAPLHGFNDAADYYQRSSSLQYLRQVEVPTLLLSAANDPFLPPETLSIAQSQCRQAPLMCLITDAGGHVGWVYGSILSPKYYMEGVVCEYLSRY